MAIFRQGPPNGGVDHQMHVGYRYAILSQYLAPSHAVNGSTAKCNTLTQLWRTVATCWH